MTRCSESDPSVWVVTPVHNRRAFTLRFVARFGRLDYANRRLVIVDDGSTDGTAEAIAAEFPRVEVLRGDGSLWWAGATNLGVRHALERGADFILTLNDDATFEGDLIDRLIEAARTDPMRIVGSRQMHADDPDRIKAIGTTCVFRGYDLLKLNHLDAAWSAVRETMVDPWPVQTMPGNGVLLPRAVFERVGLYDAAAFPQNHADSDLVLRARAEGFRPVIALGAVVLDHQRPAMVARSLREAVWSPRSDRYWPALRELLRRYGPAGRMARWRLVAWQYAPFLLPASAREAVRRWRIRRRRGG
jgi:GT2 family glycosyltransferase